jgi:hypothetical protein
MGNEYERARELISAQIEELETVLKVIDWHERTGISVRPIIEKLSPVVVVATKPVDDHSHFNGFAALAARRAEETQQNQRRRENPGGSWPDAIDAVLMSADRSLTIAEIVKELNKRGRIFPEGTRPYTIVRNTITRCKESKGWTTLTRSAPHKWRKRPTSEQEITLE